MASFNKLTIGNQTFDVSVVRELPAQWIQELDGDDIWWMLAIPTDLDYQAGQIYQIDYNDAYDDLANKNSSLHTLYDHNDGIETLIVTDVSEYGVAFSKTSDSVVVRFSPYTGVDNVTNKNVDVLVAYEGEFAPTATDIVYFAQQTRIDSMYYYQISYEALASPYTTATIFYCGDIPVPVRVLIDASTGDYTFVNINTGKSIPFEENENGYILSSEDINASNSVSSGSSSGGTQLLHAAIQETII